MNSKVMGSISLAEKNQRNVVGCSTVTALFSYSDLQ